MDGSILRTIILVCVLSSGLATHVKESESLVRYERDVDPTPKKLRIVTIENLPYTKITQGPAGLKYEGFIPDLIYKLSRRMNFEYEFYPSPDGRYGTIDEKGVANGMLKELTLRSYNDDGNLSSDVNPSDEGADMAAAPLVITSVREKIIDFVKPFHHLGLTMLTQKANAAKNITDANPFDFSILKPLSPGVWGLVLLTMIVVGLFLWLMNHFNPYEWGGRYNMGLASEHHKDSFTLPGSFWFVFSTFQWQGFEHAPRSVASKVLTCFWFFFVTLTLVTYTGALVNNLWWASMMKGPGVSQVGDLADLVMGNWGDFQFGCVKGGSTYRYITQVAAPKLVEFNLIKEYWETEEGAKQLVGSTDEGISKVRAGNYVLFFETMTAKWHVNQEPCDLTTVGQQFGQRSYGLALPRKSPYLEQFHAAILELNEEGEIDALEQKWWVGKGSCWNVTQKEKMRKQSMSMYLNQAEPKVVTVSMFWGPLVVMLVGLVISLLVAGGEIMYYRHKGRYEVDKRAQSQTLKLENEDMS